MLSMVKMSLKGEVGSHALNSHGNYIVDHGKSWKNHGIVFSNFCGNPDHIPTRELCLVINIFHRGLYLGTPSESNSFSRRSIPIFQRKHSSV